MAPPGGADGPSEPAVAASAAAAEPAPESATAAGSRIRGQDLSVLPPACATTAAVRESCHVLRVAEIDTVDLAETGQEPVKERTGARILNPDVGAVEQARWCTVEHVRDGGCRVRPAPVELKRGCVERPDDSAV